MQDSKAEENLFEDATEENPVEISRFLKHLDTTWADPLLELLFPRFHSIKKRLYPRLKLVLFQKLRPDLQKITQVYDVLVSQDEVARNLGFNPIDLPVYETIRHFINDLLDEEILNTWFHIQLREIQQHLIRLNQQRLGQETVEDATIITAKRNDPEAAYSGYYKDYGWKKDLLIDNHHKIFLGYQDLSITADESEALLCHLQRLQEIDIHVDTITVDGKYPTYENIAKAKHDFDTCLFYKPQQNWKYNVKGDLKAINKRYQKYWDHDDFRVHADLRYKLGFLSKQGDVDYVGAYYRNQHVAQYFQREKHCRRRYRLERNGNEGFNGYVKQQMGFETSIPWKGEKHAFKHTTLCIIALNAVVLTRLQHGFIKHLTSVAYLT